jgi:hypothetical protein
MNDTQVIGIYFDHGWISLWVSNLIELDVHYGFIIGVTLITVGIILFKRTRRRIKLDRNVGLLGVVSPKGDKYSREPFRH